MSALDISFSVPKRVPLDIDIYEMGANYSGAILTAEIRINPGDQGPALITLTGASPPAQGLSVSYDPAYPDPEEGFPAGASRIRMIVSEAALEGIAYSADPSKPLVLHYDIHLTPPGGTKFVFAAGHFIIEPGVTL